nr:MAG TPA: hypothetical protein [Crassvirales sp.]DAG89800.1 MAG TPA: hypothetical protein [Crassvirales sp.]DAK96753.1 MAG TPA: hypothetical protein [Bacteriophage sp.]
MLPFFFLFWSPICFRIKKCFCIISYILEI